MQVGPRVEAENTPLSRYRPCMTNSRKGLVTSVTALILVESALIGATVARLVLDHNRSVQKVTATAVTRPFAFPVRAARSYPRPDLPQPSRPPRVTVTPSPLAAPVATPTKAPTSVTTSSFTPTPSPAAAPTSSTQATTSVPTSSCGSGWVSTLDSDERWIDNRESHLDPTPADVNPSSGARGLGQLLPSTYAGLGLTPSWNPCDEIVAQRSYMRGRYGTWANARRFWENHLWW
jgi:hypothetical protein